MSDLQTHEKIHFNIKKQTVEIKFSAHDAFLEKPSSGDAQNRNIEKPNNIKVWNAGNVPHFLIFLFRRAYYKEVFFKKS